MVRGKARGRPGGHVGSGEEDQKKSVRGRKRTKREEKEEERVPHDKRVFVQGDLVPSKHFNHKFY